MVSASRFPGLVRLPLALVLALSGAAAGLAATHTPADPAQILSEDAFGPCVPEENLDEVWLVFAKGGKGGRVPHVCMLGDCEDLPDIATWAAAQQYPDDIDLDREDVQAAYAAFVAEFCVPEVLLEAPAPAALPEPLLSLATQPLLTQVFPAGPEAARAPLPPLRATVMPSFPAPMFLAGGGGGGRSAGGPGGGTPPQTPPPPGGPEAPPPANPFPPVPPLFPDDPDGPPEGNPPGPQDPPPVSTVPLPAGGWLLLSALALGLALGRRRTGLRGV